jgi:hypothetical protein
MIEGEVPRDEEPTGPNIGSDLDAAVYTLNRHLFELEHEWQDLAAGVRKQDVSQVETAAKALVAAWATRAPLHSASRRARQTLRPATRRRGSPSAHMVARSAICANAPCARYLTALRSTSY